MKSVVDEIRNRLLPSRVVGQKVALKQRSKGEYLGLCPFHDEKTPSFTVSDSKGFYHCFGCGENGDVIAFAAKTGNLSYIEAIKQLAKELGIALPERAESQERSKLDIYYEIYEKAAQYFQGQLSLKSSQEAREFLVERKVKKESIDKFRLGYFPEEGLHNLSSYMCKSFANKDLLESKLFMSGRGGDLFCPFRGRIIFPVFDAQGRVIAFGGRILDKTPGIAKYINSSESPIFKKGQVLYGFNFARRNCTKTNPIIVVEGYLDVISMHAAGFDAAVAPLGTALKLSQIELLWRVSEHVYLMMDNDTAGKKSTLKSVMESLSKLSASHNLKIIEFAGGKDPDELCNSLPSSALNKIVHAAKYPSEYLYNVLSASFPQPTPESRNQLKAQLQEVCKLIEDPGLRKEYEFYLMSRMYSKNKPEKKLSTKANKTLQLPKKTSVLESIIMCFVEHPQLLKSSELFHSLTMLDIPSKKLSKVRDHVLNVSEAHEKPTKADVDPLIISNFMGDDWESPTKNIENLEEYAIRLFKIHSLIIISKEISDALAETKKKQDDISFMKLRKLKNIQENLKLDLGIL